MSGLIIFCVAVGCFALGVLFFALFRSKGRMLMPEQVPSIGRVVHFVYGEQHYAAIITAVHSRLIEGDGEPQYGQTLFVMPPMDASFSTVAVFDPGCAPTTWHWPEHVPAADGPR